MKNIIIVAIGLFSLLIATEFFYGLAVRRNNYRLNDAISSLSQGALSQIISVFTQLFQIGIYSWIYASVALFHHAAFWMQWIGLSVAVVLYDFSDYWLHRMSHEVAVLWAAHVVHHQSQEFNLTTALRQESFYPVVGFVFFIPMAILGVPPSSFAIAGFVVLFYQFWIHTEHIGKLGWFDRIFSSPSNHRVHHAVNRQYIDKNYGAIFIIWDRLFGSFAEEDEKCVYGTMEPLNSWDPIWAMGHVFLKLAKDAAATRRWVDKFKIWWMPPGWKPTDLVQPPIETPSSPTQNQSYNPAMSRSAVWFASIHMVVLLAALSLFLWYEESLPLAGLAAIAAQLIASLWIVGAVMQGRLAAGKALWIEILLLVAMSSGLRFL
jgi:alkylglycerol monooxygenase